MNSLSKYDKWAKIAEVMLTFWVFSLGETQFFYFPLHSLQKDDFLKRQIVKTGSRTFSPISPTPFLFYFRIFFQPKAISL